MTLSPSPSPERQPPPTAVGYWAPELFKQPTPALPMDMWALGVVLYVLLAGEHPFDDQGEADNATLQSNIRKKKPNFDCWTASTEAQKLTMALLRKDPKGRMTIEQLLQHPWIVTGVAGRGH